MAYRVSTAEFSRLSSLYRTGVDEAGADHAVDHVVRDLAAQLDVPVAQFLLAEARTFTARSGIGPVAAAFPRGSGVIEDLLLNGPAFRTASSDGHELPPCELPLRSFAGVRLTGMDDEAHGILYVADTHPRDLTGEAEALTAAATAIRVLLDSHRRARQDGSTGALRRDAFLDQASRLIDLSRMGRHAISLVVLDTGGFRSSLETHAPGLGTLLMQQMADLGRTQLRSRDSFGRLGPDRFGILLTDTGEAGARVLARRLSQYLEAGWAEVGLGAMSLDLGIGSMKPLAAGDTIDVLLARATPVHWPAEAEGPASRVA